MTNHGSPTDPATGDGGTRTVMVEVPTDLRRHPFRGLAWGFLGGIGLALVLIVTKVIELAILPLVIVVVVMMLLGLLWGVLAPPKSPKGPVPVKVTPGPQPTATRFDDFDGPDPSGTVVTDSAVPDASSGPPPPPPPTDEPSDPTGTTDEPRPD